MPYAYLPAEDHKRGADGVGHGGGVVGEHLAEAWVAHAAIAALAPPALGFAATVAAAAALLVGLHDPVDGLRFVAAVPPRALQAASGS